MAKVLNLLRRYLILLYLDDILIIARNWAELKAALIMVLHALRKTGFTIKLSKCEFLKSYVTYLGYEISDDGIRPGGKTVRSIANFPEPRNVHETRRFIGLTSYARKYVPRFAQIDSLLTNLAREGVEFNWTNRKRDTYISLTIL